MCHLKVLHYEGFHCDWEIAKAVLDKLNEHHQYLSWSRRAQMDEYVHKKVNQELEVEERLMPKCDSEPKLPEPPPSGCEAATVRASKGIELRGARVARRLRMACSG